jgi:formate-dependent nitrite reductase membrane component NrfD
VSGGGGRFIDPELGRLEGEGASQVVKDRPESTGVTGLPPATATGDDITYYDLPVLKEPVWIWSVPAYFFAGGAAGAAATLGMTAQAFDSRGLRNLIVGCRRIAAAGTAAGTVLLIIDLGRPERFLNMLRVFRPTSPLSVGSWILAAATPLAGLSLLLARSQGRRGKLGDAAGLVLGVLGLPLAGYTAVLLSNTAVPLWMNVRRSLPGLFVASATSSAASLLTFANLDDDEHAVVSRIDKGASLAELVAALLVERDAGRDEEVARPLREGLSGQLWKASTISTVASLVLSSLPGSLGRSRSAKLASAAIGAAGSAAMRFAIFHAGKASARSPRATFHSQRAALGARALTEPS